MIISKIVIRNFRCYYGENVFNIKDGLTLIIGDNADGKTTFFEALEWLFNTSGSEEKTDVIVSSKRKAELYDGESDKVSVAMYFSADDESKIVEKSVSFAKDDNGNIRMYNYSFDGYNCEGSERIHIDGKHLIDTYFDNYIRKYSMFKGEDKLDIFKDDTALNTLVDKFSDVRAFDALVPITEFMEEQADKAYRREMKKDDRISKEAQLLYGQKDELEEKLQDVERDLKRYKDYSSSYAVKIENLERNQEASERYQNIKNRLAKLNEDKAKLVIKTSIDFNKKLLDEEWILCAFPSILRKFQDKTAQLSKMKRKLRDAHVKEQALLKGKKEAYEELTALSNGATALDWDMPDLKTMEEMLEDHICKVCGREAPEGSEAYQFMLRKVEAYKKHVEEEKKRTEDKLDEKPLFVNHYIEEIKNLGISLGGDETLRVSGYGHEIANTLNDIDLKREDLKKVRKEIEELEDERQRILVQVKSDGISEALLDKNFHDLKGFFEEKKRSDESILKLEANLKRLQAEKEELDAKINELAPTKGMTKVYKNVYETLKHIHSAFNSARVGNMNSFLDNLEKHANKYLQELNPEDFYGNIRIVRKANGQATIDLISSDGNHIHNPNGALKTTMYMSVLFAVSDLTTLKRDEDYPLIFDAPTSSFGEVKEDVFYNTIAGIKKQCIIVTKDLLEKDEATGKSRINQSKLSRLNCSVYRIEKARPFDPTDISTIKINVSKIKD